MPHYYSVEFCSCGMGGGRSPKTLKALLALMEAMRKTTVIVFRDKEFGYGC